MWREKLALEDWLCCFSQGNYKGELDFHCWWEENTLSPAAALQTCIFCCPTAISLC